MRIKRYDYPAQFVDDIDRLMGQMRDLLLDGRYVLSKEVRDFEVAFARYLQVEHAVGTNCGTDAIALALLALGVEPGDEVITQANTFNATVTGIRLSGARPVLVDADSRTFLMDVSQVEAAITPRTRVLMPVHLYGKPTPMTELLAIARRHDLWIVEDAAQSHGATIGGRRAGSIGDAGCFSFHPSKNLAAAGDAGCVVTHDADLARDLEELRSLGQRGQNNHVRYGMNSKLDAVQALVLKTKLPRLDGWNASRRKVAADYRRRLSGLPLYFQADSPGEEHVFHLFQVGVQRRDGLLETLVAAGIDAVVRYPVPVHLQGAFSDLGWRLGQYPVAERLAKELLCLPMRPDLREEEIDFVVDTIRRFLEAD